MTHYKPDKIFIVAAIIALIFSIILFNILQQEEYMANAIEAMSIGDQQTFQTNVKKMKNVDMVYKNETLLMRACEMGNAQAIEFLILEGADVNFVTDGGLTPLELFCSRGYCAGTSALTSLLNAGARQSFYISKPAVYLLAENYTWMNKQQKALATDLTMILLTRGGPIGYGNSSILHKAAESDMSDLFYDLVHTKQGLALINMKDENGLTPYQIAVNHGSVNVQKVIRNLEQEYYQDGTDNGSDNDILAPLPIS